MDSVDKVLALVDETNTPPKPINARSVEAGAVSVEVGEEWNTRIELEGIPGRGYYGPAEFFYDRIALSSVLVSKPLRTEEALTVEVILKLFNAVTGLWVTEDDVESFTPPVLQEGEEGEVTLIAKAASKGFIGSIVVPLEYGRAWLDDAVVSRILPVLKHPIDVSRYISARMVTWSKDFTSLRDAIKPTAFGKYTDWDTLQAACSQLGIPTWIEGSIVDKATSEVPDSNQSFDRVVIQSQVTSADMLGPIYLHYNILEEV